MTSNVFARLRRMLPEPPVIIGRVIEHHPEDDTSSILLPSEAPSVSYADDGVSAGSIFRARGRTVDVGLRAFVRAGVVESQAPEGDPIEIVIGSVCRHVNLTYVGPIVVPGMTVGVPVSFATAAAAWTGGIAPIVYTVLSGALPVGLTLNPATGVISGTPTTVGTFAGVVLRATDNSSFYASSPPLSLPVVAPSGPLWVWDSTATIPGGYGGSLTTPFASLYDVSIGSRAFQLGSAEAYGFPVGETYTMSADPPGGSSGTELVFSIANAGFAVGGTEYYSGSVTVRRVRSGPICSFRWDPSNPPVSGIVDETIE